MPLGPASLVLREHIENHRAFGLIVYLQFQLVTDVEGISGAFNEKHKLVPTLHLGNEAVPVDLDDLGLNGLAVIPLFCGVHAVTFAHARLDLIVGTHVRFGIHREWDA